jgi:hypothetical protein
MSELLDPTKYYADKVCKIARGCKNPIGRAFVLFCGATGSYPETSEQADTIGDKILLECLGINNG